MVSETPDESNSLNHDHFARRVYAYLKQNLDFHDAVKVWNAGQRIHDMVQRNLYYSYLVKDIESRKNGLVSDALSSLGTYRWQPVSVREFVTGEYYLNKAEEMYPIVLDELDEMNSGRYVEIVLTGGIGSAKTTCALYTNAYQLYLLSCMYNPHRLFGLDSSSEIMFIFQSLNAKLAKGVDFNRFKSMVEGCQYFREHYPFDKNIESRLVFPRRVEVVPVSGAETAAIGQNVIGGLIDELNYMAIVEKSKQSVDKGTYDQAVALYNSIARRRKSRFMQQGKLPGVLCLVSSKKYPGQFTDQKEEEAKTDPTIYIYDKRVWEIKPEGTFSKGWFRVFIGDMTRKPRILGPDEMVAPADAGLLTQVPLDYLADFKKDIINSLREIAGISTLARYPYFLEVDKVADSFGCHPSIFNRDRVDFSTTKLSILPKNFYKPDLPRFVHVDLAVSGDSAGLAIGTVERFVTPLSQGLSSVDTEYMPLIRFDGTLEIYPPAGAEIQFWKIRELLIKLRGLGLNIRWVTFDSYQSKDSQQLLRQQGFITGVSSMDVNSIPYDFFKSAVYGSRVKAPTHDHAQKEIVQLERDAKTGKIDHLPGQSKDVADAMAGVCYGLTMRREIWSLFSIPISSTLSSVASIDTLEQTDAHLKEVQNSFTG